MTRFSPQTEGRFARRLIHPLALVLLLGTTSCTSSRKPSDRNSLAIPPTPSVTPRDASAWRWAPPKPGKPGAFDYPIPFVSKLDNGLSLYILERRNGPVSLDIVVSRGAAGEIPTKSGLASLATKLIVEATKNRPHLALSEAAESLGSTLSGEANRDDVHLGLETLPDDVQPGLRLLSEVLREPAFDALDFRRLQKQKLDELRAEHQNPSRLASLIGMNALLGPTLGNPVGGCPESVRSLTLSDVRKWYQETVAPDTVALFIVGPIAVQEAKRLAEEVFGNWKPQRSPAERTLSFVPATPKTNEVLLLDRPGSVQSALWVAQPFPKRQTEGFVARKLLDNLLGGLFTSRINQNLRETHAYTYGARTAVIAARDFGLLTVSTSVATEVTVPALGEIKNELEAIVGPAAKKPIQEEELERARAALIHSLGTHLENNNQLTGDLEQLFTYSLPSRYYVDYLAQAKGTTANEVSLETERIHLAQTLFVVVGDATRLKPELEKAGLRFTSALTTCIEE